MVIRGVKHLAEISRMTDSTTREERFRYTLQREGSPHVLYWGHEHTEQTAIQMANLYLNLLDDCIANAKEKPGHVRSVCTSSPFPRSCGLKDSF